MNLYSKEVREKPQQHPGFAVRFQDGTWMGRGHGLHRFIEAFYAHRYETEASADIEAKECQNDFKDNLPYQIVPAWEPLCEMLRFEIQDLRKANHLDPDKIMEITDKLEDIIYIMNGSKE